MKWHVGITLGAALCLSACGKGQDTQGAALRVLLDEPEKANTGDQFPRFAPLLEAGHGPALDVAITGTAVRGGFLRESTQGNIETWIGTDGISLIFDRGVLHGTRGLGGGMLASDVSATATSVLGGQSIEVERLHTFLNGNDQAVTRAYTCVIENEGSETLQMDNGATATRRLTEACYNLGQSFKNTYWVDPRRGLIVRSRQWAGDFVGELAITTVYNF